MLKINLLAWGTLQYVFSFSCFWEKCTLIELNFIMQITHLPLRVFFSHKVIGCLPTQIKGIFFSNFQKDFGYSKPFNFVEMMYVDELFFHQSAFVQKNNAQVLIFLWLLSLLVKIDPAKFQVCNNDVKNILMQVL